MHLGIIKKSIFGALLSCMWSFEANACTVAPAPYDIRTAAAVATGIVQHVGSDRPYPQYKIRRESVVLAPSADSIAQTIAVKTTFGDIGMCGRSPALQVGDEVIVYFDWSRGRLVPVVWRLLRPDRR
jgi:hypothetical protein